MNVRFSKTGWAEYLYWSQHDLSVLTKVNALIENVRRTPFTGLGKPEPLGASLKGYWSRRITGEHRLVYRVAGKPGDDQYIDIASCRYHYVNH